VKIDTPLNAYPTNSLRSHNHGAGAVCDIDEDGKHLNDAPDPENILRFMQHSSTLKKYAFIAWFLFLTVLAAIAAYYRMFTGFSFYDDEGTLMILVKQYLGGTKLYDHVLLPYGPVYYFYNWALRTLSGTPVTHDVVRMSSLVPWLLTALVSAWIVFRLTRSLALASATHLLTSLTLSNFFHNEPGHPQELCIFLLVCVVACGIVAPIQRWRLLGMILLGVLTAALLLVKVNIGAFVFLAISLALLSHSAKTKLSRLAFHAVAAACVILPAVLMKSHLADESTRLFAVLVTVSIIAVLLVLLSVPRTCCFRFRDSWIALFSFASTVAGVILVLKAQGIDLSHMLHALVLDSLSIYVNHQAWYLALPLEQSGLLWIVGGFAAAVFFSRNGAEKERTKYKLLHLKLYLAIFIVVVLFLGGWMYELVPPFCWLALYGRPEDGSESDAFPRTLLCAVTVLQTLYAYPIAGSQRSFILVLPIILIMVCLGDFLLWQQKKLPIIPPSLIRAVTPMLLLCVAASYLAIISSERKGYFSLPSLQLRGAGRIHLNQTQARDYRWLVRNLDDHCDVFVGLPELPSLHLWTGKDPLAGLEVDNWMLTASNEQQIAASTVLSEHPNACAIRNPDLVGFWTRTNQNLGPPPLARYLHENFKVVGSTGQFSFLVRNERNLNIASTR
jgi:hypothetical protein